MCETQNKKSQQNWTTATAKLPTTTPFIIFYIVYIIYMAAAVAATGAGSQAKLIAPTKHQTVFEMKFLNMIQRDNIIK